MKNLILIAIRMYWILIPQNKRRKCIFKKSCSNHVFEITKKEGLLKGLDAFWFRFQNCRGDFEVFVNPHNSKTQMQLPSGLIIEEQEIAERLIK